MPKRSNISLEQAYKWIKERSLSYTVTDGKPDPFKEKPKDLTSEILRSGRKAKYNNEKVEWGGEVFDSKREYSRYRDLLLLVKAGEITLPKRQVVYELNEGGTHSYKYVADFVYIEVKTGKTTVEDCKGFRTREYKKKRKLMKKIYNIIILET